MPRPVPETSYIRVSACSCNPTRLPSMLSFVAFLFPSGATPPLTLTLRDDCASLWVTLPSTAETPEAGEEPSYTVYVVPDFDSTAEVTP